jgi:hypothetical protein
MNWLTVRLTGCRIVYLPAGEPVEFDRIVSASVELRAADAEVGVHPRLRRVLWRLGNPDWKIGPPGWDKKSKSRGFLYSVLHWQDGEDLDELDAKVRRGEAGVSEFSGCLAAEVRRIMCLQCHASFEVVIAHAGDGPRGLADRTRIDGHRFYRHCPSCAQSQRWPLVVEFLNQHSWPGFWHIQADPV